MNRRTAIKPEPPRGQAALYRVKRGPGLGFAFLVLMTLGLGLLLLPFVAARDEIVVYPDRVEHWHYGGLRQTVMLGHVTAIRRWPASILLHSLGGTFRLPVNAEHQEELVAVLERAMASIWNPNPLPAIPRTWVPRGPAPADIPEAAV